MIERSDPTERAGARLALGDYELLAELARGGMGAVYVGRVARAFGFERLVAIKLLHEHLLESDGFLSMLLDEARTAAHIEHPNAIGILDVGESDAGPYLVMSYVEGFSFDRVMRRIAHDERARIRVAMRLLVDAAHGLHAAHTAKDARGRSLGIVHRDVSPQNVLVGSDGSGRIIDFGIALAASRITASSPGVLKGKPAYMSPEQAGGQPCDARSDVFSLAVVAWEALTNRRLFRADDGDIATLMRVMSCDVAPPAAVNAAVPVELSDVVCRALSPDPDARQGSARELGCALERAAAAAGLLASTDEVAATVSVAFAREIAERRASLASAVESVGAAVPVERGSLARVPRLGDRRTSAPPSPPSTSGSSSASGSTSASGSISAISIEVQVTSTHVRRVGLGRALSALAVAAVVGAALALVGQQPPPAAESVPVVATDAPHPTSSVGSVSAPIVPASTSALGAVSAPRVSERAAEPQRVEASEPRPRRARAATRPARRAPPALEANPYLAR